MTILKGIIHNGQIVLAEPTDLPEGTEVQIVPTGLARSTDDERPAACLNAATVAIFDSLPVQSRSEI
jgi:hypothetical protein